MNRGQAAALLGVSENATEAEARKAYLARARIMHPDRFTDGTDADRAAATQAMAQLNEAMEVFSSTGGSTRGASSETLIIACPNCGRRNRIRAGSTSKCGACGALLTTATEPDDAGEEDGAEYPPPGFPTWPDPATACRFCGWGPAKPAKFNSVLGIIIWWRWSTVDTVLCRECATFVYNQEQASTLVKGWWGLIAPVANIVAFLGNFFRYRSVKGMPEPVGKCWEAPALVPFPLYGAKPWWKRIGVWVVLVIAVLLASWLIAAALSSQPQYRFTPTTPSGTAPATQPPSDPATGLQVGDCIGGSSAIGNGGVELSTLTPASCGTSHVYEVMGLSTATGASFSLSGVKEQADSACTRAFQDYTGVPYNLSDLTFSYIYPSAETWAAGDRQIICLVADASQQPRTGSLRNSGVAANTSAAGATALAPTTIAQPPPSARPKRTEITLAVAGCDGCSFTPYSVRQDESGAEPYTNWEGDPVTVRGGTAAFTIPTRYTKGMSLRVTAPWESGTYGAVPMVTMAQDSYCWEGTTATSVTLDITTTKYKSEDQMYGPSVVPNAYLSDLPEPDSPPGHQDLPYCEVPR